MIVLGTNGFSLRLYFIIHILTNLNSIEPVSKPNQPELNLDNQQFNRSNINTRATLPKTGYGKSYYVGNRRKVNMKVVATAAAGAIAYGTQSVTTNVYYDLYQAQRTKTYGAVKEERRPYTQIQNKKFYGNSFTWYFWSSRPY